jgi:hypothetical protein
LTYRCLGLFSGFAHEAAAIYKEKALLTGVAWQFDHGGLAPNFSSLLHPFPERVLEELAQVVLEKCLFRQHACFECLDGGLRDPNQMLVQLVLNFFFIPVEFRHLVG